MKTLLYIDSDINRETSRTERIARRFVPLLQEKHNYDEVVTLVLEDEDLKPLDSARFNERAGLIASGELDSDVFRYAHLMKEADGIVIAAPFWDCSYPALLKLFIEEASITNIVYRYTQTGETEGLCHAQEAYYITTCGGYMDDDNSQGYENVRAQLRFYGVDDCTLIKAEGLDIVGNDIDAIVDEVIERLPSYID